MVDLMILFVFVLVSISSFCAKFFLCYGTIFFLLSSINEKKRKWRTANVIIYIKKKTGILKACCNKVFCGLYISPDASKFSSSQFDRMCWDKSSPHRYYFATQRSNCQHSGLSWQVRAKSDLISDSVFGRMVCVRWRLHERQGPGFPSWKLHCSGTVMLWRISVYTACHSKPW